MILPLGHGRWRRQAALLAAGALDEPARARMEAHAAGCARCAEALAGARAVMAALDADPAHGAEPPIPLSALRTRVFAQLDAAVPPPAAWRAAAWRAGAGYAIGTAGAVALALLAVVTLRGTIPRGAAPAASAAAASPGAGNEEFVRRLERNVAREQAARYLDEAGDVLVTVAAQAQPCHKDDQRVDVAAEAQRSRALLAKRSLLDVDAAAVVAARPVLDDVEQVLREVASLESCARKRDLDRVHRQIEKSRLLLKIDLTTRELEG
jgi:hypothetical protein